MNHEIIGRLQEQAELATIFKSPRAELVAVYGRRRVGKTYLINNFFKKKKCVFFSAIGLRNGTIKRQLDNFKDSISETFYNGVPLESFKSWKHAFQILTTNIKDKAKNGKVIIFLDELPWMATVKSGFLNEFDYFWNKYWSNIPNLKLIICGSSASWIIKKIINDKGGLHNRVTRRIILKPFLLYETKAYLKYMGLNINDHQVLEAYITLGGIPFYLNQLKYNLSITQNINDCFKPEGLLFNEFDEMFESLFNNASAFKEIVRNISSKLYGIERSDLENKCKLSSNGGTLSERLQDLENAGFIISFIPYKHKSRGVYYRIIDEYIIFYLKWIEPYKLNSLKINSNDGFWLEKYKTGWLNWSGYAFESVCYKHISQIKSALKIPTDSIAATWRYSPVKNTEQGAQIDLLFDRSDDSITICEIKYTTNPFEIDKSYRKILDNKCVTFKNVTRTNKQIFLGLISANGVRENMYSEEMIPSIITLEHLMKEPK